MKTGLLVIILFVYLPEVQPYKIPAVVNTPVYLPCEIECPGDAKWIRFIRHKQTAEVAHCTKGKCWIEDSFQKRFTFPGDRATGSISLLIQSVLYIDEGFYRCSCDGKVADVKLNVFVPTVKTAHELENVSLSCYGDTRRDAKNVQWKKDNQLVLLYNRETRERTRGNGFEDRFWVSPESYEVGDLSLHIDGVRRSDAGLYVCTIHDESIDGEPRAVLLKVEESSLSAGHGLVIGLAILFALISLLLAVFIILLWRTKIISWQVIKGLFSGGAHTPRRPVQEENRDPLMEKSSTKPIPLSVHPNEDQASG